MNGRHGIEVLFEDAHLIVAVKPAGLPSQKSFKVDWSFYDEVRAHLGGGFTGLVHRLDRTVAGIMVCAKTPEAARRLSAAIRDRKMEKTYLAVVEGILPDKKSVLKHFHEKKGYRAHIFSRELPGSKPAVLAYEVLEERPDRSLVRVSLDTGRYNQIRAQFAYIRHPILADHKYTRKKEKSEAIGLCAYGLVFEHPFTGTAMRFTLPAMPRNWSAFWPS